ncbi:MAG: hypothetical protein EP329_14725 [Deltaproteobacteria bacterium]|nr:MAG: hypothetical protein EP329_14725 [Deltaproteobacteria bacterium]
MRALMWTVGLSLVAWGACGGGTSSGGDDTAGGADTVASDTAGDDTANGSDTTGGADTAVASDTSAQDTAAPIDVVTGDKQVGEACGADSECVSGICLSSSLGSACTAACSAESDCDGFPIGMFCLPVRPGRAGCVPEADLPSVPSSCGGHGDCAYPLYCRTDDVGCDLPECLVDGDCDAGEVCEAGTRRCQPATCADDIDCRFPGLVCADDQSCAAPACTTDADCGALPNYCQPAQHACKVGVACEDQDGCFYNEQCSGGYCVPNLCWKECDAGEVCDPGSGWCGAPCSGAGQAGCPSGQACLSAVGVCAPNTAPVAVITVGGASGPVAEVAVGQGAALSAAGSVDPEGESLTFRWTLLSVPAGSTQAAGTTLGTAASATFTPDVSGRFVVGVYASDPAGLDSIEAAAILVAR